MSTSIDSRLRCLAREASALRQHVRAGSRYAGVLAIAADPPVALAGRGLGPAEAI